MKYIKKVNTEEELNNYWATSDYKDYSIVNVIESGALTFGLGDTFPTPFKAEGADGKIYTGSTYGIVPAEDRENVIKVFLTGYAKVPLGMFPNLEEVTFQKHTTRLHRYVQADSPTKIKVLNLSNMRGQKGSTSGAIVSLIVKNQDVLEEVILPDEWSCTMTKYTFENCPNLEKIIIGDNSTFRSAFNYSPFFSIQSLKTLEFKGRSKHYSKHTSDSYADRRMITINVMQGLAKNCNNLESIKYPTNLVGIGYNAFTETKIKTFPNVTGLKYVDVNIGKFEYITIPSTVEFLASPPFVCKGNTKISVSVDNKRYKEVGQTIIDTYNNSMIVGCINSRLQADFDVESIYHYCFNGNDDIINVHLGDIKQIDSYAFNSCHNLKSIVIHTATAGNVPVLQANAFTNCESLESIYVPIDKVDDYKAATNWNEIADKIKPMIPYTVVYNDDTSEEKDNFEEIRETSTNIKSIICGTQHTIAKCPVSLTSITVSDYILRIPTDTFMSSYLTEITLPNVRHIESYAFHGCINLINITIPQTIPPIISTDSFNITPNCKIYVPAEAVDTYKADANWTTYADRILPIPETNNNNSDNNNSNN